MKKGSIIKFCLAVALLFMVGQSWAQGYRIEATLKGLKDTSSILGHYNLSGQQFIAKDTARADANGRMVFEGKNELPGGLYIILLPGNQKLVQIVYSGKETNFSVQADTSNIVKSMVVKGSEENQIFYEYQSQLGKIIDDMEALNVEKKLKNDNVSQAMVNKKINDAQQKLTDYRKQFMAAHSESFAVKLMLAAAEPELPPAPVLPNGRKDSLWTFHYYKAHYWDNFDFGDSRLLRAPFFQPKLERYVKDLIVQVPDSVIKDTDALVQKAGKAGNKDLKSQIVWYVTSEYENPKVVGTEGVFVHMAEKYYLTGDMQVSDDAVRRIRERIVSMKPLLVDKIIPDLTLGDPEKKPVSIHGIKADYTVLFFYLPSCGHCKDAAPVLKKFYDDNKSKGVKAFAIATADTPEDWKKFIKEYKLEELYNGYDYTSKHDFRTEYDVAQTPTIYVLDKNKKIIARKMPIEQLDDFFNFYLRNKESEKKKSAMAN